MAAPNSIQMTHIKTVTLSLLALLMAGLGFSQNGIQKHEFYGKKAEVSSNLISLDIEVPAEQADDKVFKLSKMPFNSKYSDM